jgi:hypothetical protein
MASPEIYRNSDLWARKSMGLEKAGGKETGLRVLFQERKHYLQL